MLSMLKVFGVALLGAAGVLSCFATLDWLATTEFQRGVIAGRKQVIEAQKHRSPSNCLAWWFQGDPSRADRNLRAACAARKDQ